MSDSGNNEKIGAALLGGAVGLGIGALLGAAMTAPRDRRVAFMAQLNDQLAGRGVTILSAELGRAEKGLVWLLGMELPNRAVLSVQAPLGLGTVDPYSIAVVNDLRDRIVEFLPQVM